MTVIIVMCAAAAAVADVTTVSDTTIESRMELIVEFDSLVAEFLDKLFRAETPDVAILEWCEKSEMRAAAYPAIRQAFGCLYVSIKSRIKGDVNRGRIAFQQAIRLMTRERYDLITQGTEKEPPLPQPLRR
ncbi:MAG: hypothetical protein JXD19_03750 [Deltaproteobacteria bacterium]|nr:hypothetical protein [Deltaproteobacteria bacterium]